MTARIGLWGRRVAIGVAALLLLGFGVGTLAKRDDRGGTVGGGAIGVRQATSGPVDVPAGFAASRGVDEAANADVGGAGGSGVAAQAPGSSLPALPERVIRTGTISVEVGRDRFERAWGSAMQIATRFGGYVSASSRGSGEPVPVPVEGDARQDLFGTITMRVPAERFEQALAAMRGLGEVVSEVDSSQDVSVEYVDLESRLRHLRAQEAVLLRLMARARTIEDTIVVQQRLSDIQLQIEEITGRLRFLRDQTQLSTITLQLAEPGAFAVGGDEPSFREAWETALEGLERLGIGVMLAAIWLTPFALVGLLVWQGMRRWRARPAPQE